MSEEEAINNVDKFVDTILVILPKYSTKIPEYCIKEEDWLSIKRVLNYIDKLQKELQYEKNEKMNLAYMLDEKDEEIKSLETDLEIGNNICANLHKENEKLEEILEEIKEYINSPEFLDWHLKFKLIDELEYRKDRINKLLGDE